MGKVILILGSMYAEKTTELIKKITRAEIGGKKTIILKPDIDTRYSTTELITHSGIKRKCESYDNISDDILKHVDIIGIDEGQFANNLRSFIDKWNMKDIIISGLNGTFERNIFPEIANVIGYATDIIYLKAMCKCGKSASYSKKLHDMQRDDTYPNIGGFEDYEAVCHLCY